MRNPRRNDEDGNELEDDDVDEQADIETAARNPYSHIKLEGSSRLFTELGIND